VIVAGVDEAVAAGARRDKACELLGLSARGVARWKKSDGDARRGPKSAPPQKLTPEERQQVLDVANSPEYRDLSPRQIVPLLVDRENKYIASESTYYRVLREAGQLQHRDASKPRQSRRPDEHVATGPNQVWAWDITYLRSPVRGKYFYLYMIVDVWSRKIVGWAVHEEESADLAKALTEKAIDDEKADPKRLVLHADNGGPMKGSTMLATLQRLGVVASFSRPSVSDDNAFAEALFRTLKYRPGYPRRPFASYGEARDWVEGFVGWYNDEHLHSAIRYVTPAARHAGLDKAILANRHDVYVAAHARKPIRWSRNTRNWKHIGVVRLNPVKHEVKTLPIALSA
jgi:transposase InsO family protein